MSHRKKQEMTPIIGERLRRQREAVGMKVTELADLLGVSRNTITNYESGKTEPGASELMKIVRSLGCSLMDLLPGEQELPATRFAFRAHQELRTNRRILASAQKFLRAYADIEAITGTRLLPRLREFPIDPEKEDGEEEIERAAAYTRDKCSTTDWAPERIAQVLESLGIRCLFFDWEGAGLDALSVVQGDMKLVMLHRRKRVVERTIMSAAHELGHLVLHPDLFTSRPNDKLDGREYEKQANFFAGCFLVPTKDLEEIWRSERLDRLPLERALLLLKEVFRVSFWALYQRVLQIGLAEMEYRHMVQRVKRMLGVTGRAKMEELEPNPLPEEALHLTTRFQRLICSAFLQGEIGTAKVAEMLQMTVEEAKELTTGWVTVESQLVA